MTFREQFRAYIIRLTSLLKEAKRKYYQGQLLASQGNPKSHWSTINSLLGTAVRGKNSAINLKPVSHNIPDAFNEHFLKAGGQATVTIGNTFF